MKKVISIIIAMMLSAAMFAQGVPQTVNFSATVRDANNELLANTPINVRLTFYEGGESGAPVYCALHQTITNANGFMSFQLNRNVLAYACNGAPNTPFEEIPWENGNYWMHVEYQAQIAGDFIDLGYLELTSGFYAFSSNYALIAQKLEGFDIDVTNAQDGDILVYNGAIRKWEARRPENIGGGSSTVPVPSVITLEASNIIAVKATLNGEVISDGGEIVLSRGFMYGTSADDLSQNVQSGNGTGSFTENITGLADGTTYYYKAYATSSAGTGYGEVMSFTTPMIDYSDPAGYTNGYGWVDLGLPSGTKWATCNVGASTPTAYGNYYAWGETTPKTSYTENNYTYSSNSTTLPSSADAATANWGSGWRMPTLTEFTELVYNCTYIWTTLNGVNGLLFIGPNGNSIFMPAAGYRSDSELISAGTYGYYWSITGSEGSVALYFELAHWSIGGRREYYGFTVRPVCVSQN